MNLMIEMDMEDIKDRNQLTKVNIKIIKEMVLVVFGQMEITIRAISNKIFLKVWVRIAMKMDRFIKVVLKNNANMAWEF
jgi:hypothetical protein